MFLRVVILVSAATCCTAQLIDVSGKQSALERSGKFEGDIMLTDEQRNGLINNVCDKRSDKFEGDIMLTDEQRNGMINRTSRWPNKTVPFYIDDVFNDHERNQIMLAIEDFHKKTPILFKQYNSDTDTDYIHITGEDFDCWSYVGRKGGRQELNLDRNRCIWHGTIIHELLHALGFWHQHSAADRDDYVTINWENIEEDMRDNFKLRPSSESFGVPYDYDSVMHYSEYAFSKDGLKTIEPKDPNAKIGQRDGFSAGDIKKLVKMYTDESSKQNAWERSGKFEGDIMLTEEQMRNGLIKPPSRWPNKKVPFVIDDVFTDYERKQIQLAIFVYLQKTPILFKEYDPKDDTDYIHITGEDNGCWSYVGRIGGRQQLNLQHNECLTEGTIIHELLHALGFFHQHSATDRDDYVTINWDNIELGAEGNFSKYDASTATRFGVPYDYASVMHYGPYAFSRNGKTTIEPKDRNVTIGQRDGISEKDIEKLAEMYEDSFIDLFIHNLPYFNGLIIIFITIIIIVRFLRHLQLP